MGSVPDAVRDAARAAFGAGPSDSEVADLIFDSLLDPDPDPAPPGVRRLRFECAQGGAQLEVTETGSMIAVRAQVMPALPTLVEVRSKAATFTAHTDDNGVVRFEVPAGLVSLIMVPTRVEGRRRLQTAWVRL